MNNSYSFHNESLGPWAKNRQVPLLFWGYVVTPEFDRVIEGMRYRPQLTAHGFVKQKLGSTGLWEPVMRCSRPVCADPC